MKLSEVSEILTELTQPVYLYIAGGVLLLACILILLKRRQPRHVVAYTTENGRVMVSRAAIVELVQTSCQQLKDVSKPNVRIQVKGDVTHFDVRIALLSGGRLRVVEQTLQTHLRRALTENLGIENLGRINIVATGFKSGRIEHSSPVVVGGRDAPDPTANAYEDLNESEVDEASFEEKNRKDA